MEPSAALQATALQSGSIFFLGGAEVQRFTETSLREACPGHLTNTQFLGHRLPQSPTGQCRKVFFSLVSVFFLLPSLEMILTAVHPPPHHYKRRVRLFPEIVSVKSSNNLYGCRNQGWDT